jgi:integrase
MGYARYEGRAANTATRAVERLARCDKLGPEYRKGGALTSSAIGQMMAELVKAAGKLVPQETSAHSLRHTFARGYLSMYPGDAVGLATLLGHSSLDTTRLCSQPAAS